MGTATSLLFYLLLIFPQRPAWFFLTQLTFYCLVINMSAEVATKMLEPHIKKLEDLIESNPKMDQSLIKMEEKTKVKKVYIAIIFIVLVVLWLGSGHAGQLVCNFIGFLYPAYSSIKAIESHNKDDDTKWLIYWVVFATFSMLESFSDIIIGWLPFYWLSKCLFLVWCMSPANGSAIVYRTVILPVFRENEEKIDKVVNQGKEKLAELAEKSMEDKKLT